MSLLCSGCKYLPNPKWSVQLCQRPVKHCVRLPIPEGQVQEKTKVSEYRNYLPLIQTTE